MASTRSSRSRSSSDVGSLLDEAANAIDESRWRDAAASLVAAWRVARCARIARALSIVDTRLPAPPPLAGRTKAAVEAQWHELVKNADEEVLRRLLAVPWPTHARDAHKRVEMLAPHISPRVSTELLALHRKAKWTSAAGNRLSRTIFHQLIAKDDHAVVAELEEMEGHHFQRGRLGVAVFNRRRPRAPELSAQAEAALARIDQLFSRGGKSNREALLAAIYEAPHDDAPRMVYADVLTEEGDPRGELITIQLARANTGSSFASRRELKLLKDAGRQWFDGIDNDGAQQIELARGFPSYAIVMSGNLRTLAWATIEKLFISGSVPPRGTMLLRGLRVLRNLRAAHIGEVELPNGELEQLTLLDSAAGIDRDTTLAPRVLVLHEPIDHDRVIDHAMRVRKLPIGRRVETVGFNMSVALLPRLYEIAEETGLAIETAGWRDRGMNYWTARFTKQRLQLDWTGVDDQFVPRANDTIRPLLARFKPAVEEVLVRGIRDDDGKLTELFAKWPNIKTVQFSEIPASERVDPADLETD